MSAAPDPKALERLEAYLRQQGLKMTAQRRRMVEIVLAQPGHFSADDLHARLRQQGEHLSLATVYRSLQVLEAAGILEGHDFDDGQRRYERLLERAHHDHMVCIDCRLVVEFQNDAIERLQEKVASAHQFRIREHHLTLYVACEQLAQRGRCERRDAAASAARR